jgi:hypothetical protein
VVTWCVCRSYPVQISARELAILTKINVSQTRHINIMVCYEETVMNVAVFVWLRIGSSGGLL